MAFKVFLGNSPWHKEGYYGVRAGSRWPHFEKCGDSYMPFPFFLAYSTALLEKNGFECSLVDGIAEGIDLEEFFCRLERFAPDIVVYEVSTPSIDVDLLVAEETRKRLGIGKPIIFCGPHFSMYSCDFLKAHRDVDFVVQGEYEFVLLELLERLKEHHQVDDVPGLIFRAPNGEIVVNERRPLEQDLQKFPWPARHHLPMMNYCDLPGGIPAPSLQIWASRGCPYGCIFCSWPQIMYGGSNYRTRDPNDVVDEIEYCIQEYGFKSFYFDDDTFNIGKSRILALCDEIARRNIGLPWAVMARADCVDREILFAMKRAGLVSLKYGVESADPVILAASGKSLDLSTVRETISLTREAGISFHLTFTFGLPGETRESIKKTVDFALEMDPDSLQFSIVTPFPGSSYFKDLDKKGYLMSKDWERYDGYSRAVIRTDTLSAKDLEKALVRANRRWKRHIFLRSLVREPSVTLKAVFSSPIRMLKTYYG